jgi:DNA (cytosine-5)-methyltransferase 1
MVQDRKSTRTASPKTLKALSFFSGAMGLDNGLERVGIKTLLACEFDKASRETIAANNSNIGLIGDITAYSSAQILTFAGLSQASDVDLIVGGPPCQAFSTAGKRKGFEDTRGNVFLKYLDVVTDIRPKYVVIENVRGLMSSELSVAIDDDVFRSMSAEATRHKGASLYYVKKRLEQIGYTVSFNLYNAANFGTPQIRERVVIIGTLDTNPVPHLKPTHSEKPLPGLQPWRTFREVVSDLPPHQATFISYQEKRLKFLRMLGPGQNWRDLPETIQPEAMGKSFLLEGGKTGFYRRLAWDKPAPTLVTHPTMPATDLAHPEAERPLSIEEYKRIQEFPDDWIICGKLIDQYKQVGNAVPVSLGAAIGQAILDHQQQKKPHIPANFVYSRYKNTADSVWQADFENRVTAATRKDEQLTFAF